MPLRFDVEEYLGTNADLSRSDEYCYYCLKDGEYIVDIPMEQMIDIWIKYTDKYNEYSGTYYNPQELRTVLNRRLPTLKRWKQIETTRNVHHAAISTIKTYIDQNLFEPIDPGLLCGKVNLSLYHFRRIFKSITGENIGSYIQRLRLEYVAHTLISTDTPIGTILKQTNYQTIFSLSKAFKKHFGIPMTEYRLRYQNSPSCLTSAFDLVNTDIKKLKEQTAICHAANNISRDKYIDIWKKLIHYSDKHLNTNNGRYISISMDNPLVTPKGQCRMYLGIMTDEEVQIQGKFSQQKLPGGLYAIFTHKGSYASLPELYEYIYEKWLPKNNYSPKYALSFEIYLTSPRNTKKEELLTEIYIPIQKN